ncbi:hypothetical protein F53441_4881 [Fusarium austroafricanum]|uniref:Uncharacterized protein n=1 Tax=Fusarium austroafricanum TaxID=2364996 RepID=A0A8H4P182_9HYPO|nr:hypothetical protein F53441_4881 [Fusarium austroafricanum]
MQPNDNPQLSMPNSSAQSLKRHFSQSKGPYVDNVKRQRISIDKSTVTAHAYSDVAQTPGSSFILVGNLQSTNNDTVESPHSSLDPSREPQDPYDDPYDDPELDQYLESLNGPFSIDKSGASPVLDDTDEFPLEQSDRDALAEFLEEES